MKSAAIKVNVVLMLLVLCICPSAFATKVDIDNPSFELFSGPKQSGPTIPSIPSWGIWYKGIPGWTGTGSFGIWDTGTGLYSTGAPAGENVGYLSSGSIFQALNWTVNSGNIFTLSIDIGNRSDLAFPNYGVELWAGDNVLVSGGSVVPGEGLFSTLTLSRALGENETLFNGKQLGIKIWADGPQLNFDNLKVSNDQVNHAVPEPTTMLLLGLGLIGLAGYGHRKFKNN